MTETTEKKLSYIVEADFNSLGKGIRDLIKGFKEINTTFQQVGKQLDETLKTIKKDAKDLEQPFKEMGKSMTSGFKAMHGELKTMSADLKAMRQDFKNALGFVQESSVKTAKAVNHLAQETTKMGKSMNAAVQTSNAAMKSLTDENAKTQASFRRLADEANKAKGPVETFARDAHSAFQDLGDALQAVGLVAGAAFMALKAGIGGTLTEFGNFEAQLNTFRAVSSATAQEMAAIKAQALEIGGSTKFTATEIAAAQVELAKMGFTARETTDAMKGMVSAAIASGESLDKTSAIVASTLRMFNMQASESQKVADVIARASNISALNIQNFADSMRYVGSAAAGANQDLVQMSGLLAILADRGIKGTVAGNGLQNAIIRLQAPTKAAKAAIEELNLAIADTKGTADEADDTLRPMLDIIKDIKKTFEAEGHSKIKQADLLKDLFGEVSLNTMQVFMNTHNDVLDSVMAKQHDYRGSSRKAAEEMQQGWNFALEKMQSAINALQISLGEALAPTMIKIAGAIETIANGFNGLPAPIKSVIMHIGLLATAAAGALVGAAGVSWMFTQVAKAGMGLDKVMGGTLLPMFKNFGTTASGLTGPIMGIASKLGHVGIVAGTTYTAWKTNFGGMREIVDRFMEFLRDLGIGTDAWVSEWNAKWAQVGQFFKGVWLGMADTLVGFLGFMDESARSFFGMIDHISKAMRAAADMAYKKFFGDSKKPEELQRDWNWFKAEAENAARSAQDLLSNLFNPSGASASIQNARREMAYKKFFGDSKKAEELQKAVTRQAEQQANAVASTVDGQQKKVDLLDAELDRQKQLLENDRKRAELHQHDHPGGPMTHTYDAGVTGGVTTSGYGMRKHPIFGDLRMHTGIDAGLPMGAPIKSQSTGKIAFSGNAGGYGKTVIVDNGDGTYWLYGHASELYAQVDREVKKGAKLAAVGSTGNSTGPHLHTELRVGTPGLRGDAVISGTTPIDPLAGRTTKGIDTKAQQRVAEVKYYQDLIRLLSQYEAAYKRVATTLKGEEKDKAIDKANKLAGEILDARNKLKELGVDASKEIAASGEAALKAIQDDIKAMMKVQEDYFKKVAKAAEDAADEGKKAFYALKDASSVDSDALNAQLDTLRTTVVNGRKELEYMADVLAEFKKNASLMTPDQRRDLKDLEESYDLLAKSIGRANFQYEKMSGQKINRWGTNVQPTGEISLDDIAVGRDTAEKTIDRMVRLNKVGQEYVKTLLSSDTAMAEFVKDMDNGGAILDRLINHFGLTEAQLESLMTAIGKAEGFAAVDSIYDSLEHNAKVAQQQIDKTQTAVMGVVGALQVLLDFLPTAFDGLKQVGNELVTMIGGVARGVSQTVAAIKDNNPIGVLVGALSTGAEYWSFILGQFGKLGDAVKRVGDEAARLKRELRDLGLDATELGLTRQVEAGERSGVPNLSAQTALIRERARRPLIKAADDFEDRYGLAMPTDADGNYDPAALESYIKRKFSGNAQAERLQALAAFKLLIAQTNDEIHRQIEDTAVSSAMAIVEKTQALLDKAMEPIKAAEEKQAAERTKQNEYLFNRAGEKARESGVEMMLDTYAGADEKLRETLRGLVESIVDEQDRISREVNDAYANNAEAAGAELMVRLNELSVKSGKALAKAIGEYQKKAHEEAEKASEKQIKDAEDQLKRRIDALKKARTGLYDDQAKAIQSVIDAEEIHLKRIEAANKLLQQQIDLKEQSRRADLETFDANDKAIFAQLKAQTDYAGMLREGLGDISNPNGVLTSTYSTKSIEEAIKARVEQLTLENENAVGLEEISQSDYLGQIQRIAAFQARASQEAQQREGLTSKQRNELRRIEREAYTRFQQAYREQINLTADAEVQALQRQVEANTRSAETHKNAVDQKKAELADLRTVWETDMKAIDDRVGEIMAVQDAWVINTQQLKDGIKGPLEEIIATYNRVKNAINVGFGSASGSGASSGAGQATANVANAGSSSVRGTDGKTYFTTSELFASYAGKAAKGALIPPGYPNDTFPALLSSDEMVLPPDIATPFRQWLQSIQAQPGGQMLTTYNQQRSANLQMVFTGNVNNPAQIQTAVFDALRTAGLNPNMSRVNGRFMPPLN